MSRDHHTPPSQMVPPTPTWPAGFPATSSVCAAVINYLIFNQVFWV